MQEITIDARIEHLPAVTAFVDEQLEEICCPLRAWTQIDIALDELFGNIARYAYPSGGGKVTVRVTHTKTPKAVTLTLIDSGVPYNPLAREDPDVTLSAEQRKIGGLGIFLVKKSMDEMSYAYEDGKNILRITKRL